MGFSDSLKVITTNIEQTMKVYTSLKVKLPIYEHFIDTGEIIFSKITEHLKEYNKEQPIMSQKVTIAIEKPLPAEISKVLGFFQYSGLLLPKGEVSKGDKGTFERYVVHYAAIIDKNALFGQKSKSIKNFVEVFDNKRTYNYTRMKPHRLVALDDIKSRFSLSLPPCQVCGTPRLSEKSKFCSKCGTALKTVSIFESLVATDIEELPLTIGRVKSIKSNSRIKTVKDILMDIDKRELRGVPGVGPYWAKKITFYAEEFIS